ncbi:MAG: FkbM family methyltransferase [Thermodesulfovibrionales bacterium]
MLKRAIIKFVRKLGLDLLRYTPENSNVARMQRIFSYHHINLVLDVGANIGQYAKSLREIGYTGKIVSFEPLSSAYAQLTAASGKDPLWEVAPRAAIGDRDGEITINISKNSVSSSVLPMLAPHLKAAPDSGYVDSEMVSLYKLDSLAYKYIDYSSRSVYLKMDVQGFELQVLEGASKTLPMIKGIQLEMSLIPLYEGEPVFKDMLGKLEQLGYELYALIPGFTDGKTGRLLQLDGIFFLK